VTGHDPAWPHGLCSRCGLVWPCTDRVDELLDEHGLGLPFAAALWELFVQAAHAVPQAPFLVLYEQCIRQPLRYAKKRAAEANR
jgi:hypothetical protein